MSNQKKSFEEQLADLEQIVTNLENGAIPLDEALTQFQTGVLLSKNLEQQLAKAEATVAKLMDEDGQVKPLDVSENPDDK
ncbi:hypothetical protein FC62_GL000035 [Amylolactobacillus amylotrophicus DSM 20534]|uniref:Exodeoxyribonuclease VII small subunit n=3 Tax=Amylolactobacillus TaxID=2767876 RepID=A0A1L6XAD8_9LACO|nr:MULTISPECIES: exodeoxyribonuclease VII small subunit [Amylolactobacillus]APT17936.1 exodeoxyribonuclease VII small subunit [Amylolactobacillus amylophilus DSM 20533 = JCM 1125]KRK38353.1 hypothetical protein FC62_GL000035 [Amylolactobacillus amylotrophicus DSM 20534]KRM43004.1 hypothetical protein FD40_GL000804 [Amylolactobacillus amylophilus DSM 20533 = JCM 1125]GED79873.1 exodeoxyribonuclease 7 small subunit [Amylolactobacillus amylophilus]